MEISRTLEDIYAPLNHYLVDWRVEIRDTKSRESCYLPKISRNSCDK